MTDIDLTHLAATVRSVVPPVKIPLGFDQYGRPPVLVMVTAFSRFITALMLPSLQTIDWSRGCGRCCRSRPFRLWCCGTGSSG
jgi:hypothetical protein